MKNNDYAIVFVLGMIVGLTIGWSVSTFLIIALNDPPAIIMPIVTDTMTPPPFIDGFPPVAVVIGLIIAIICVMIRRRGTAKC